MVLTQLLSSVLFTVVSHETNVRREIETYMNSLRRKKVTERERERKKMVLMYQGIECRSVVGALWRL